MRSRRNWHVAILHVYSAEKKCMYIQDLDFIHQTISNTKRVGSGNDDYILYT